MSLFGKSDIEKEIIKLTDEFLPQPDLGGNLAVADMIKESSDDGKAALKQILKQVKHKSSHTQRLALSLLDVCVKNAQTAFHQHLADNLKVLVDHALDRHTHHSVQDVILTLIESWAEAFTRVNEFQIPAFDECYKKLKAQGVEFPARDMTAMAPIQTPKVQPSMPASQGQMAVPPNYQQQPPAGMMQSQPQMMPPMGQPIVYGGPPPQQLPYAVAIAPGPAPYPGPPPVLQPLPYYPPDQQGYPAYLGPQPPPVMQPYPGMPPQPMQPMMMPGPGPHPMYPPAQPAVSPSDHARYSAFTAITPAYVDKVKQDARAAMEYVQLLVDLSRAADSPASLQSDALANSLARNLLEVRDRTTKLIVELGDVLAGNGSTVGSPTSASTTQQVMHDVETLMDVSVKLVESMRVAVDYHAARCQGREGLQTPSITMPSQLLNTTPQPGISPASPNAVDVAAQQMFALSLRGSTDEKQSYGSTSGSTNDSFGAPPPYSPSAPSGSSSSSSIPTSQPIKEFQRAARAFESSDHFSSKYDREEPKREGESQRDLLPSEQWEREMERQEAKRKAELEEMERKRRQREREQEEWEMRRHGGGRSQVAPASSDRSESSDKYSHDRSDRRDNAFSSGSSFASDRPTW